MKLRNFLYLNNKIVDDYISAIDGYVYEQEDQIRSSSSMTSEAGKAGIPVVAGSIEHEGKRTEEVRRSVKISDAAKIDRIIEYLGSEEELKYYESLSDESYSDLQRGDFLEVLVTARFSKMKALSDSVKKLGELAETVQGFVEQPILDRKAQEAIKGFSMLGEFKGKREVACVFSFDNNTYPMVAYLDESYFRCNQDNFIGQSYMLCKVIRKVPKGNSIELDEIFDDFKKLPMNRAQRRNMPKNLENPAEMKDVIKGPAIVVLPVAIYQ